MKLTTTLLVLVVYFLASAAPAPRWVVGPPLMRFRYTAFACKLLSLSLLL